MFRLRSNAGFTLIELLTVVVILAVISLTVLQFISFGGNIYQDVTQRDALLTQTRFTMQRLSKELSSALPGSVRTNNQCIEFVPVKAAGYVVTAPTTDNDSAPFTVISPYGYTLATGDEVAIYPRNSTHVYGATPRRKTIASPPSAPDTNDRVTLDIDAGTYPVLSPSSRYFVVHTPVSWCIDNAQQGLWRFYGYGWQTNQPSYNTLLGLVAPQPMALQLIANPGTPTFSYTSERSQRYGIVQVVITAADALSNTQFTLQHEVPLVYQP